MARKSKSKRVPQAGQRVKLRPTKRDYERNEARLKQTNFTQAAPFFSNPRGVLSHRVRTITKLDFGDRWHYVVEYWCQGSTCHRDVDEGLVFDPGKRLVCEHCERKALERKLPSSSALAGRHVCTGVCRPINTCPQHQHQNEKN